MRQVRLSRSIRSEKFGYIISPPFTDTLLFIGNPPVSRPLSAPIEAHISLTSACPNRCPHCYEDSSAVERGGTPGPEGWKRVISTLGSMGVFNCAFGGGEPAAIPWLFGIAEHARSCGIVPNLTTSGAGVTAEWAKRSEVFGQVNVSFDGRGGMRSAELAETALGVMKLLARFRGRSGINCVLTRDNFGDLDDICAAAKSAGLNEVEILRFKPAGRAAVGGPSGPASIFTRLDLTREMYEGLPRAVERLIVRHRLRIKLDCSFVPAIASAGFAPWLMELCGASGCEGGNELCAIGPSGSVTGCSFCRRAECGGDMLSEHWSGDRAFSEFRRWEEKGDPRCLSCDYFNVCRGGCHVISEFAAGSWYAPDPSCALARR